MPANSYMNQSILTPIPERLAEGDAGAFDRAYGGLFRDALQRDAESIRLANTRPYRAPTTDLTMGAPMYGARALGASQGGYSMALAKALEDARRRLAAIRAQEQAGYAQDRMGEREGIRAADRQAMQGAASYWQGQAEKLGDTLLSFVSFGGGG